MSKPTALEKILRVMRDGEARTISRIHYLTNVSPTSIRRALLAGDLIKVGEEPNPVPPARQGQAIVKLAPKHLGATCQPPLIAA
jgi:hypothetical protein